MSGKPKVVACIPARMTSTRLPGKGAKLILGKPMLTHQIERVKLARRVDEIVLATTTSPTDDTLVEIADEARIRVFRGSEDDVLDRIYQASVAADAGLVLRLTGDGPLLDPAVVDRFVDYIQSHEFDYVGVGTSYPDGQDVEVMSMAALTQTWREAVEPYEREHVSVYTWQSGKFRTARLEHHPDLSSMRWEVNEEKDLEFVTRVYEALYPEFGYAFGIDDILDLLSAQPEIAEINEKKERNEGFLKSLREFGGDVIVHDEWPVSEAFARESRTKIPSVGSGPIMNRYAGPDSWDLDGNAYLDFSMGGGAIVLGHGHPVVVGAIQERLSSGWLAQPTSSAALDLANLLSHHILCAERVLVCGSGNEAVGGALRLAMEGKEQDVALLVHPEACGPGYGRTPIVPRSTMFHSVHNLAAAVRREESRYGAIWVRLDSHHGDDEDCLVKLREIADDAGLTLVCDETITGFRHALGGLHTKLGIAPDLVVFAETLSHGLSFGLIVGRASYLDSAVNVLPQDALLADPIGLAAASMIVRFMTDTDVVSKITLLAHQLRSGITRLAMDTGLSPVLHCGGTGSHVHVAFGSAGNTTAAEFAAAFQQGSVRRGVLTDALSLYPSYGHEKETIDRALRVYIDVFEEIGKKC